VIKKLYYDAQSTSHQDFNSCVLNSHVYFIFWG